jgi:hypothetical protein
MPRGKSKPCPRVALVVIIASAALLLVCCLPVIGLGLYWLVGPGANPGQGPLAAIENAVKEPMAALETPRLLVGMWEGTEPPKGAGRRKPVISFRDDGIMFIVSGPEQLGTTFRSLGMVSDFGLQLPERCITYRFLAKDQLEIAVDLSALGKKLGADPATLARDYHKKETVKFAVSEQELAITNDQGKVTSFRRLPD